MQHLGSLLPALSEIFSITLWIPKPGAVSWDHHCMKGRRWKWPHTPVLFPPTQHAFPSASVEDRPSPMGSMYTTHFPSNRDRPDGTQASGTPHVVHTEDACWLYQNQHRPPQSFWGAEHSSPWPLQLKREGSRKVSATGSLLCHSTAIWSPHWSDKGSRGGGQQTQKPWECNSMNSPYWSAYLHDGWPDSMSKDTHGRSELEDRGLRTAWDCHKWEKPAPKTLLRCDLSYFNKF